MKKNRRKYVWGICLAAALLLSACSSQVPEVKMQEVSLEDPEGQWKMTVSCPESWTSEPVWQEEAEFEIPPGDGPGTVGNH